MGDRGLVDLTSRLGRRRVAGTVVGAKVVVIPDVDDGKGSVEQRLGRRGQHLIVGIVEEVGIVADDVFVVQVAQVQEEERLVLTNGVEDRAIGPRRRAVARAQW